MLISDEDQHSRGFVEFKNASLSLTLVRAVELEEHAKLAYPAPSLSAEKSGTEEPCDVQNWITDCKSRISNLYCSLENDGLLARIDDQLLSPELMECLGFPMRIKSGELVAM